MVVFVCSLGAAKAQIITDSDRRLKTVESDEKGGFLFFKKKKEKRTIERSAPAGQQEYRVSETRFSPQSPFNGNRTIRSPRSSIANRSSLFRDKKIFPRYSREEGTYHLASPPRYSPGRPFTGREIVASPRYSLGNPFSNREVVTPRYSPGRPFSDRETIASPRYSIGSPFTSRDYKVKPRYSAGSPFSDREKMVKPRYSNKDIWSRKLLATPKPRYSPGDPFDNITWVVKPLYSTNKHRFEVDKRSKKENAVFNFESGQYKGTRPKRFNKSNTMHPSSVYKSSLAFNMSSEEVFRKWNVIWSRLDGNKVQPPSVKDKIDKPKFDRKETDIWNN
ncbi:MAG: hypothetical protein RIA69_06045 [Cyclobacteriaceae bacterium]